MRLDDAFKYDQHAFSIALQTRSKEPNVKWKEYQTRHPNLIDLRNWSSKGQDQNFRIVTGEVSKLVVIDIDTIVAEQTRVGGHDA